ncbi:MAG: helix-turn-helix domain-containing protein [Bacteroidota bacterium]
MEASILLFTVVLFLGCLQGLIMGIILIRDKGPNQKAHKRLAILLFFFSYRLLAEALKFFEIGYFDFAYHITLEYNWIYGPLIYFFVRAYIYPEQSFKKNDYLHFLPVLIEFLFSFFIKSQNFFWDGTRESLSWAGYWGYVLWMHTPFMYLIAGLMILLYARKSVRLLAKAEQKESLKLITENLKWIKQLLLVMSIYSGIFLLIVLVDYFFFNYAFTHFDFYPPFLGLAAITYWIGLQGFTHRSKVPYKKKKMASSQNQEVLQELAARLQSSMKTEKLYTNPELSLHSLAEQFEVKPYLITESLNQILGKSFKQFINEFRLAEVQEMLASNQYENFTLLGIAYEAGFNSKASFNRVVKQMTGKSPKELKSINLASK